jgi:methylated-DNA-[protein]-cysteine S-methyltransferase
MGVEVRREGVWRVVFDQPSAAGAWRALDASDGRETEHDAQLNDVVARLTEYAHGDVEGLEDVEVDLSGRTPFQVCVLQACRRIPPGQTRSYAQLAAQVGSPLAARAVGSVMARNQVPLIVPCHRVVGSDQSLGGFSSRSGLQMKRRLLALEAHSGLALRAEPR